jgi:hypothetical protein
MKSLITPLSFHIHILTFFYIEFFYYDHLPSPPILYFIFKLHYIF